MYERFQPGPMQTRVTLLNSTLNIIAEGFTDNRGEVRMPQIPPGSYRLRVSGPDIQEVTTDAFLIFPNQGTAVQYVTVRPIAAPPSSTDGSVSAYMLAVPPKAQREFERGLDLYRKDRFDEAAKKFEMAASQYSHYAAAFDHLGLIAMRQSKPEEAEVYFNRAIEADKQYAPVYLHFAKARLRLQDYKRAQELLDRNLALEPRSSEGLFWLVFVHFNNRKSDDVIAASARLHQMEHEQFAAAHVAAGDAYRMKNMPDQALAEYKLYLKESPKGQSVDRVKASIAALPTPVPK